MYAHFLNEAKKVIKGETTKTLAFWSDPPTFYVDWGQDAIIEFWGGEGDIDEFIKTYPNNLHILSMEETYYFSAGKSNRYGSYTNY
jgi:hypothetical protein